MATGGAPISGEQEHDDGPVHPSAYEQLRLDNIDRNEAELQRLGLFDEGPIAAKAAAPRKKARRKDRPRSPQMPARSSARVRDQHVARAGPVALATSLSPEASFFSQKG
eukprot:COSAG04_NODE_483_length_13588_cov_21.765068_1_plen_108_part_10